MSGFDLSEKEQEIIKLLALGKPKTGYSLSTEGEQRTVSDVWWAKIRTRLLGLELISEMEPENSQRKLDTSRHQKYYWLSVFKGTGVAISLGVRPEKLAPYLRYAYNSDAAWCVADFCEKLPEVIGKIVSFKSSFEAAFALPKIIKGLTNEERKIAMEILEKYRKNLSKQKYWKELYEFLS